MAIRVALIGTGNCGSLALKQLVNDARFDLSGVWVSTDAKVGKDAGELAGLDVPTGVAATNDLDAIIAAKPDCTSYTMDICPTSRNGDHNYAAILAAAGRIVNAIPDVVAAQAGIRTTLDMPLVTGKGLYTTP
jgi:2,4-diaminopentanoate dehydrogenase